jgi:hypothetical protein
MPPKMPRLHTLIATLAAPMLLLGFAADSLAQADPGAKAKASQLAKSSATDRREAMNQVVSRELMAQLDYFFKKVSKEKLAVEIDGFAAFKGNDKFLPGKIAVAFSHLLIARDLPAAKRTEYVDAYRAIAEMTVDIDNETWGIYYYLSALNKLKKAGLLESAISPTTLAKLRKKLDWRVFVNEADYTLINLPTNYYGVAFSVARLRTLMGWEDESASNRLLEITLAHYDRYSKDYGFSDETDGEGRYDRYSILLIAEICQRFVDTGLPITPRLTTLLRKASTVALNIASDSGEGFSFGRSIGPYADTSMLEILSVAAYLNVLTAEEKRYAYAYSSRIAERYVQFWYDADKKTVDMWGQGRRTDAYRGRHRILGENLSLLNQLIATNNTWNKAGFENARPAKDLAAWLGKTQPPFHTYMFSKGEYDRALAIYRDRNWVFSLLMVNGGPNQHANSPYYPLPFSNAHIAGVADSGAKEPQLLPKFTLADGSELIATSFIKNIRTKSGGSTAEVAYEQDALNLLGKARPIKDTRITLKTSYRFAKGKITRTDVYAPNGSQDIRDLSLSFASFSSDAKLQGSEVSFGTGEVTKFVATGFDQCTTRATDGAHAFKSPNGAMLTHVQCRRASFTMNEPITLQWVVEYK